MRTVTQRVLLPSLAVVTFGLTGLSVVNAQMVSARPASIGLTVVIPPHAPFDGAVASEGSVSLIGATPTAIDLETKVGLANRPPARIEVRLGAMRGADSTRVWVRNRRGEFERLFRDTSIVALDGPADSAGIRSALRFRVEPGNPRTTSSLVIPIEYRLTVGSGDDFSVWTVPSLLRVDSGR